jgi:hypothetical protein
MRSCKTPIKIKLGMIQRLIFAVSLGSSWKFDFSNNGISIISAIINTANIISRFIVNKLFIDSSYKLYNSMLKD